MDLLFIMDPLERLNPAGDSTLAMMRAAHARGHQTFFARAQTLTLEGSTPWVKARAVEVGPGAPRWRGEEGWREVSSFPIVWLRTDPPFDSAYVEATWILDGVDRARCRVLNDPTGIRGANEKLYALKFADLLPPTLVTADVPRLRAFVEEHGEVVLKPLGGAGGEGIVFANAGMRGLTALLEVVTARGARCQAQRYLPGAPKGDKRILLLDGAPLGAVLRIAGPGEERNNLHLGGRAERAELTPADRRIVERLAPSLKADGLVFVGIDVIDDCLTEVNVTSPTGLVELLQLEGVDGAAAIIEWCEAHGPAR